jgi:FkbM family methyltransferase
VTVKLIDTRHGPQLYFDNDVYFGPLLETFGEYVPGEVALFRQLLRPGDVVVDAGANIGCFSVVFGRLVGPTGRVLAFEPQQPIYYALCGTLALNELWQVAAFHCALGATVGTIKLPPIRYDLPFSFGSASVGSDVGSDVPIVTLDHLNLDRLRLLKIDVEGHETEVLEGARETIARTRPFLSVENDRIENSDRLIEKMLGMGYRLYLHTPLLYERDNWRGSDADIFPNIASINLFGIPEEHPVEKCDLRRIERPEDMIPIAHYEITPDGPASI